jgi:hypothetical protein
MSFTITDPATGEDVTVFGSLDGGYPSFMCRALTEAHWTAAAVANKLLAEFADEKGNKSYVPSPGISIAAVGPITLKPAVLDEEGNEVTPAVTDDRFHVNFMIDPSVVPVETWLPVAANWTAKGADDTKPNDEEVAKVISGIGLIDPGTIKSASSVWL